MKYALLLLSAVSFWFGGCGSTAENNTVSLSVQQPHKKSLREIKDWSWNVGSGFSASAIFADFYDGLPSDVRHIQYFIDADNDPATGYNGTDGWEIIGADYLIEDGMVFRSASESAWEWDYIGKFETFTLNTKSLSMENPTINLKEILPDDSFSAMIEVYDQNWSGNYPTVTDLTVQRLQSSPHTGKKVTRKELEEMIANDEDYSQVDVSGITDMSNLFLNKEVKFDITGWDVSNVTNMSHMFSGAKTFNQPIGNWDVSNVTDMSYMFGKVSTANKTGAESFNQPIGNWDVSSVTNMQGMFYGAYAFNQPIANWDVSHVVNMGAMFYKTDTFNQPIGNWNVSSVTNMRAMFTYSKSFNQHIGNWDVSNVANMRAMFLGTENFNQPIGNWDVSSVTDMGYMFYKAYSFDRDISNWDVSKVTSYDHFNEDSSLSDEHIPHFQ